MKAVNRRLIGGIKAGIVLYTLVIAVAGYMRGGHPFALGVLSGGTIGLLEFWSTAWLVEKIIFTEGSGKIKAALGLAFKSIFVLSLVVALMIFKAVDSTPFLIGLLSLFFGIIIGVVFHYIFPFRENETGV